MELRGQPGNPRDAWVDDAAVHLAKLWSVMPKLFQRPVVSSFAGALERISLLLWSGASCSSSRPAFSTSTATSAVPVNFYAVHYYGAWVFGTLFVLHACVKLPDGPPRLSRTRGPEAPVSGAAANRAGAAGRRRGRSGQPGRAHDQSSRTPSDVGWCVADHLCGAGRRVNRRTTPTAGVVGPTGPGVRNGAQRFSGEPHGRVGPDHPGDDRPGLAPDACRWTRRCRLRGSNCCRWIRRRAR